MDVWTFAVDSLKPQQETLGRPFVCTLQGGSLSFVGSCPVHVNWRCLVEPSRCCTLVRKPSCVTVCRATVEMQVGGWTTLNRSVPDGEPGKVAGSGKGVTVKTVNRLCQRGELAQAIEAVGVLVLTDCRVTKFVFYTIVRQCVAAKDLCLGRRVHALAVEKGYDSDAFLGNHILRMYISHTKLQEAMDVLSMIARPDAFTWSAVISGHVKHGEDKQAIELYRGMRGSSVEPDGHVFVAALQACARGGDLKSGQQVHADVLASGVKHDLFVWNSLVDMYAKCGSLEEAQRLFDGLGEKDVVTWNALIAGYAKQGMGQEALHLYRAMEEEGIIAPNSVTFVCLLQACASVGASALEEGKQLHAKIKDQGLQADVVVGGSLVNMYAKCVSIDDARYVFDRLDVKNVVTWSSMIAGYSQQGMGQEALRLYRAMQEEGLAAPDSVTFGSLLRACASVGTTALEKGKQLHAEIRQCGLEDNGFVASSLVNMYAKCGGIEVARGVFDSLRQKNVVTWSAMVAGYSQQGMGEEALRVYEAMQEEGIVAPNSVTFVCLLQACSSVGTSALEKGRQLHAQIRGLELEADVFVASSLVHMYAKCGSLEDAERVFEGLGEKNVVTWSSMIAGYSQQGMGLKALRLHTEMQQEGMAAPDSVTFACLLQACASIGTPALEKGRQLHAEIREQAIEADLFVANSLVTMYAKCGSLEEAREVFDALVQKDVVTWNAMIAGYSQQGMGLGALELFRTMQEEGIVEPNCVTFVCLLQACASVAALPQGRQLHVQIKEQNLHADLLVAGNLINMYGKCGSMLDARQVFQALPKRDVFTWSALIAGYTRQGDSEEVFGLLRKMEKDGIQPDSITFLSVLTVCSHTGLVNKGRQYFEDMSKHYGITPTADHYTCMVDLLGRSGQLQEALALIQTMSVPPDAALWRTLLGACQKWSDVTVGLYAFNEAVKLDEKDSAAYVLMSNVYTSAQMWEQAREMQSRRKTVGAWKQPGQTWWTDMNGQVHRFSVADL